MFAEDVLLRGCYLDSNGSFVFFSPNAYWMVKLLISCSSKKFRVALLTRISVVSLKSELRFKLVIDLVSNIEFRTFTFSLLSFKKTILSRPISSNINWWLCCTLRQIKKDTIYTYLNFQFDLETFFTCSLSMIQWSPLSKGGIAITSIIPSEIILQ